MRIAPSIKLKATEGEPDADISLYGLHVRGYQALSPVRWLKARRQGFAVRFPD